jgi:hypothetical protein
VETLTGRVDTQLVALGGDGGKFGFERTRAIAIRDERFA